LTGAALLAPASPGRVSGERPAAPHRAVVTVPAAPVNSTVIASGRAFGDYWWIRVIFDSKDCYRINASPIRQDGSGSSMGWCGPHSTPDGRETIVRLPLGFPSGSGADGLAVAVSPRTARLVALLPGGSSVSAKPVRVRGRRYAAMLIPGGPPPSLTLEWLDGSGRVFATLRSVQQYGDVEFKP
jgi:hypothetical protein